LRLDPACLPAEPAWSEMQGVWKLVSWATGKGEEEEGGGGGVVKSDGENEVPFKADGDSFGSVCLSVRAVSRHCPDRQTDTHHCNFNI
jgi:hypothetical protein